MDCFVRKKQRRHLNRSETHISFCPALSVMQLSLQNSPVLNSQKTMIVYTLHTVLCRQASQQILSNTSVRIIDIAIIHLPVSKKLQKSFRQHQRIILRPNKPSNVFFKFVGSLREPETKMFTYAWGFCFDHGLHQISSFLLNCCHLHHSRYQKLSCRARCSQCNRS